MKIKNKCSRIYYLLFIVLILQSCDSLKFDIVSLSKEDASVTSYVSTNSAPLKSSLIAPKPVYVEPFGNQEIAQGVWLAGRNGCVVVTAAHAVDGHPNVALVFENGTTATGKIQVLLKAHDIAVIGDIASNAVLPVCGQLPTRDRLETEILSGTAAIHSTGKTGTISYDHILIQTKTTKHLYFISAVARQKNSLGGKSGAPVFSNSVMIGMHISEEFTENEGWKSIRSDALYETAKRYLASPNNNTLNHRPYDDSILPADIQEAVRKARNTKKLALEAARKATRTYQLAKAAKQKAIGEFSGVGRYREFRSETSESYYWGEVKRRLRDDGTSFYSAHGFGVSEIMTGPNIGQVSYCQSNNGQCEGFGVFEYGLNNGIDKNLKSWYGGAEGSLRRGYGILKWKNANDFFGGTVLYKFIAKDRPLSFGVYEFADGSRYEGAMTEGINGLGIVWENDGSIRHMGRYDQRQIGVDHVDDLLVEDRAHEVLQN